MLSRRIAQIALIGSASLALLALPTTALAGNPDAPVDSSIDAEAVSPPDAVAADLADNGELDDVVAELLDAAAESPTVATYDGGGDTPDDLPPPADCDDPGKGEYAPPKPEGCLPTEGECQSNEECMPPAPDCDFEPCIDDPELPEEPEFPEEPELTVEGGGGTDVGGGGDGWAATDTTPSTTPDTTAEGGGGLPFTGLPIWWTIIAGGGLIGIGAGTWAAVRGRRGER